MNTTDKSKFLDTEKLFINPINTNVIFDKFPTEDDITNLAQKIKSHEISYNK